MKLFEQKVRLLRYVDLLPTFVDLDPNEKRLWLQGFSITHEGPVVGNPENDLQVTELC